MTTFYIGLYTLFLTCIWGFFIVAKIHAYKFQKFSYHISKATFILMVTLMGLSVMGYILIFSIGFGKNTFTIDTSQKNYDSLSEIDY